MRRKETQARPENGPIPVTAQCTLNSAVQRVALEPVQLQRALLSFAFLSQDFPGEATQAAQILQGSVLPVLPLAMIQHFNHPGPDQMEGPTPSSNTSKKHLPEGQLLSLVHLCGALAPVKVTPPNPGDPLPHTLRVEEIRI